VERFINADTIARGLDAFSPGTVAMTAGRVMLERLKVLAEHGESFAFETTLASRSFAGWIRRLQNEGYGFLLIFVALQSPEMACARVADRAQMGGHHVDDEVVGRRFYRGLRNFFGLYQPMADGWWFYDNSAPGYPDLVAHNAPGKRNATIVIPGLWKAYQEVASDT
jgi:predicted ABC-type ATPase